MTKGPVFIVDDDHDDFALIELVWEELELKNQLLFFDNGEDVLKYLTANPAVPFMIICDVNIPAMDGFELREKIIQNPSMFYKSTPFIFWSTSATEEQIKKAYDLAVQGFFIKEHTLQELKQSLIDIIQYWKKSKMPK